MFAFNIERPDDLLQMGNIDLASMVYILAAATVALILLIPEVSLAPLQFILTPVLALYGIGKYWQLTTHEDISLVGYVAIIEVGVLAISIILAQRLAHAIVGFEKTINAVLLGRVGGQILSASECEQAVSRELLRARQYKHHACLLYIRLYDRPARDRMGVLFDTPQTFQNRYMLARIVEAINDILNDYSVIGWYQGDLVIYLPETDRREAGRVIQQLYELLNKIFSLQAEIGLAMFPDEALIYEDLVLQAHKNKFKSTQEMKRIIINDPFKEAT